MIHSGSRNLGKKVADYYNKIAVDLNEKWYSKIDKSHQLAFLPINTEEAKSYIHEMQYCVEFALANRNQMIERIKEIFTNEFPDISFGFSLNVAHNYAAMENHFKQNVMVHRKGATSARAEQYGIIPGPQGTKSYIVQGKGNPESFESCSHGAGRTMGRKQAIKELDLATEQALLDKQGIIHSINESPQLDEAPSAYKNIDVVMENQKDLVDIVV